MSRLRMFKLQHEVPEHLRRRLAFLRAHAHREDRAALEALMDRTGWSGGFQTHAQVTYLLASRHCELMKQMGPEEYERFLHLNASAIHGEF